MLKSAQGSTQDAPIEKARKKIPIIKMNSLSRNQQQLLMLLILELL
ncbi:hypothetical protein HMPREF1982_03526 [Clostridiales bacterium oral taxon 876 str. F0540]|nr:hypothetical protein HMPREF1982_03526 [Clostridiales bacterium oral taxon 876 str. F0540]